MLVWLEHFYQEFVECKQTVGAKSKNNLIHVQATVFKSDENGLVDVIIEENTQKKHVT